MIHSSPTNHDARDLSREAIELRLPQIPATISRLTPREHDVMTGVILGQTAQETAASSASRETREVHRQRVFKAFEVHDAMALAREVTIAGL